MMPSKNKIIMPHKWVLIRDRKTKELNFKPQIKKGNKC